MTWKIREIEIDNPVVLAPMAGVCNAAFRTIVKEMGTGLIYAEMVSDKAVVYQKNADDAYVVAFVRGDYEVNETNQMIAQENLDVRTITLGISLLDCIDSDLERLNEKIYNKIYEAAKDLVASKAVIVNLDHMEDETSPRRMVDFLSGVVFAMDGDVQKIAQNAYVFCPPNMFITGGPEALQSVVEEIL